MQYKKLILVGNAESGKTTFIRKARTGENETHYIPTMGVEIHAIQHTNVLAFKAWDTAGREEFGGLRSGYYINAEACLLFHDASDEREVVEQREDILEWIARVTSVCPGIPIVLVLNKRDLVNDDRLNALHDLYSADMGLCGMVMISSFVQEDVNRALDAISH